jgi:hypothetical protein
VGSPDLTLRIIFPASVLKDFRSTLDCTQLEILTVDPWYSLEAYEAGETDLWTEFGPKSFTLA